MHLRLTVPSWFLGVQDTKEVGMSEVAVKTEGLSKRYGSVDALADLGLGQRARCSYVVYGYLGWSLLVEVVGGIGTQRQWLLDTLLFHQMAAAPAVDPNWTVNGVMIGVGLVTALFGLTSFRRQTSAAA